MNRQRQGVELTRWLNSPAWRRLPDFLDMPQVSIGAQLQKNDIMALRMLATTEGEQLPTWCLAGMVRLYANKVIDRKTTETGATYAMTPYAHEVLRHNTSFRQVRAVK
jgi:hypothetical protein